MPLNLKPEWTRPHVLLQIQGKHLGCFQSRVDIISVFNTSPVVSNFFFFNYNMDQHETLLLEQQINN
eukprot:bmy_16253T0